jgi:hypothetical protein
LYHGLGRKACRSRHMMEQKLISSGAFALLNQFSERRTIMKSMS